MSETTVAVDGHGIQEFSTVCNYFMKKVVQENGKEKDVPVGRPLDEILIDILIETDQWPRRVGKDLFFIINDKVYFIEKTDELVSCLQVLGIQLDWKKGATMASKAELFHYIQASNDIKQYDAVHEIPHFPPMENVFYTPEAQRIKSENTGAFTELMGFFTPASDEDRSIMAAMFATPLWNCLPGSRPFFVIEGPENDTQGGRGVGKSVLVDAVANVCSMMGIFIDVPESSMDPDAIKKLILNNDSDARVVRYDNVKKAKLSSEMLESIITTPIISSHKLRLGHRTKPNIYTYIITFNDASLSTDLATRAVRLRLARFENYDNRWKARLLQFIRENRSEIISDIFYYLCQQAEPLNLNFRFPEWVDEVLSKFAFGSNVGEYITTAKVELNDERDELDEIESVIATRLSSYKLGSSSFAQRPFDPFEHSMFIPNSVLKNWLAKDMGIRYDNSRRVYKLISRGDSKMLFCAKTKFARGVLWTPNKSDHAYFAGVDERDRDLIFNQLHHILSDKGKKLF